MDSNLLATIITAVLALLGVLGGGKWYLTKIVKLVKEAAEVGAAIDKAVGYVEEAMADNVITADEVEQAKEKFKAAGKEIDDVKAAWDELWKKIK